MSGFRVGIIGGGKISSDFATAFLEAYPSEKFEAIACRDEKRGKEFQEKFGIVKLYTNYEDIVKDDKIDLLYIGLINPGHLPNTINALTHKKAVLCEKPLGMTLLQVHEMITAAKLNSTFLMEAVWSRCVPAYAKIRSALSEGAIGKVLHIDASFEVPLNQSIRLEDPTLGGSALLDIGIYLVQFAFLILPFEQLRTSKMEGVLFDTGVDKRGNITFVYKSGATAFLRYAADFDGCTSATVYGEKGRIHIPRHFWCPTEVLVNEETFNFPVSTQDGYNFMNSANLKYEAQHVIECLKRGDTESPLMPLKESLAIAETMFGLLSQVGAGGIHA